MTHENRRQDVILKFYRWAAQARRIADAANTTAAERTDFLAIERAWLLLARSYGSEAMPKDPLSAVRRLKRLR